MGILRRLEELAGNLIIVREGDISGPSIHRERSLRDTSKAFSSVFSTAYCNRR